MTKEPAQNIAARIIRDCRALHDLTPPEAERVRSALRDMADGLEEIVAQGGPA